MKTVKTWRRPYFERLLAIIGDVGATHRWYTTRNQHLGGHTPEHEIAVGREWVIGEMLDKAQASGRLGILHLPPTVMRYEVIMDWAPIWALPPWR